MKILLGEFKGIMPKIANDKLPDMQGQIADDIKTASGEIRALRASTADVALSGSSYKTFFEYLEGGNNHWVYYDLIAHWCRSPIAADTFERMYVTGADVGVKAVGLITFTDGMTDGETLTIGTETFEFDVPPNGVVGGNTVVDVNVSQTKEAAAAALAPYGPQTAALDAAVVAILQPDEVKPRLLDSQ